LFRSQVSAVPEISEMLKCSWAYLIDLHIRSSSFSSSVLLNVHSIHTCLCIIISIRFYFHLSRGAVCPVQVIFPDLLTVVVVVNSTNYESHVGFEVTKSSVLWDITPCSRYFLATCFSLVSCLAYSSTLKMEAPCCSESSGYFQRTTRRYIPEVGTLYKSPHM
jgi:hypothetical protein